MRHLLLAIALTFLVASLQAAFTVEVHRTTTANIAGVAAALVIDAQLADVSVRDGVITITGRSAGTTQLVLITAAGTMTVPLTVRLPKGAAAAAAPKATSDSGQYGVQYSSGASQLRGSIDLHQERRDRKTDLNVTAVHTAANIAGEPKNVIRAVTWRTATARSELTLFDANVNHSRLTVDDTIVRGIHLIDGNWRLHAGYTSNALYDSVFIPTRRELVFGGAYVWQVTPRSRLMPSLFAYPTAHPEVGQRGGVASLTWDYANGDFMHAQTELGVSHGIGAATLLEIENDTNRLRLDVRHRPRGFASAGPVDVHGTYSDLSWSTHPTARFSADLSATANHFELPHFDQRTAAGTADLRLALSRRLALLGGGSWSRFGTVNSESIPLGLQFDVPRFGASLIGRYAENNATNRGGFGVRATSRVSAGQFLFSGSYDRQKDAPTVSLIFRDDPELAQALDRLGISVSSPEDVARVLRDNPALISLGFIEGVNVNLAPLRTYASLEAAWIGIGPSHPQLRFRLMRNRIEGIASATTTSIASLTYAQRLTGSTDVYAGVSRESMTSGLFAGRPRNFVELGIRRSFDSLPSFGRSETINGIVFLDDDMNGVAGAQPSGIAGIEIAVDGSPRTHSGRDGRYSIGSLPAGVHRIVAHVADGAYFTTASSVDVDSSQRVDFGISHTPARVNGIVRDDMNQPVGAIAVALTRGNQRFAATTASDGRFSIAAPPAAYDLEVTVESLPSGYVVRQGRVAGIVLSRTTPADTELTLHANRSVSGTAAPNAVVSIRAISRTVNADATGSFVVRDLPAGTFTLESRGESHVVEIGVAPVAIRGIVLTPSVSVATKAAARTVANIAGDFAVQFGAFRQHDNAVELLARLHAAGIEAKIVSGGRIEIVRSERVDNAGAEAKRASSRRAGFDSLVVRVR